MSPLGAAIGGGASMLGSAIGGYGATRALSKGMASYRNYVNQGTDELRAGMAGANEAYKPYEDAGVQGLGNAQNLIDNRTQAQGPTASNINPMSAQAYLDPSANYSMDQANKATTAAAIASGGMGGGMMKALSNNANKMAQTNWNNAFQNSMAAGNMNFGQQQQQYQNNNQFQQDQINNQMGLTNMGLSATGSNQQLQSGYRMGINDNFGQIAANQMAGYANKGNIFNSTMSGLGKTLATFL